MVGGYDFFRSEFNRAVQARRQPGSAFKPFVYIAALESGLTAASRGRGRAGRVPAGRTASRGSRTTTIASSAARSRCSRRWRTRSTSRPSRSRSRSASAVPSRSLAASAIESPLGANLSLALGTSDLTLLELTSAYGALANQGSWMRPTAIRYVLDAQGKLLEENAPAGRQAVSPEIAYVVTQMLRGTVERGTGAAAKTLGRPAAAKTGTTNDYSNAWFMGYTPTLATGVWVGL